MTATERIERIEPRSDEMLKATGQELQEWAAGRGKKAEEAQFEMGRRRHNRAVKRQNNGN